MDTAIVNENHIVYVRGDVNFKTARTLYQQSKVVLEDEPEWCIDFSSVTSFNSALLGLMIEWIRLAQHAKKKLVFQFVPSTVSSIANVAGLTSLFEDYGFN